MTTFSLLGLGMISVCPRPGIGGGVQLHSGAALLQDLGVDLGFAQPMRRIRLWLLWLVFCCFCVSAFRGGRA